MNKSLIVCIECNYPIGSYTELYIYLSESLRLKNNDTNYPVGGLLDSMRLCKDCERKNLMCVYYEKNTLHTTFSVPKSMNFNFTWINITYKDFINNDIKNIPKNVYTQLMSFYKNVFNVDIKDLLYDNTKKYISNTFLSDKSMIHIMVDDTLDIIGSYVLTEYNEKKYKYELDKVVNSPNTLPSEINKNDNDKKTFIIQYLFTNFTFKKSGYGNKMIKNILSKPNNYLISIDKTNTIATHMFQKFGFINVTSITNDVLYYYS